MVAARGWMVVVALSLRLICSQSTVIRLRRHGAAAVMEHSPPIRRC